MQSLNEKVKITLLECIAHWTIWDVQLVFEVHDRSKSRLGKFLNKIVDVSRAGLLWVFRGFVYGRESSFFSGRTQVNKNVVRSDGEHHSLSQIV